MSKTAQRKRSAYKNAYRVGRFGWPKGVAYFRVPMSANGEWRRGLKDGRREARRERREAAVRPAPLWQVRLAVAVLAGALALCIALAAIRG